MGDVCQVSLLKAVLEDDARRGLDDPALRGLASLRLSAANMRSGSGHAQESLTFNVKCILVCVAIDPFGGAFTTMSAEHVYRGIVGSAPTVRDRSARLRQEKRHGLANDVRSARPHGVLAEGIDALRAQHFHHAAARAWSESWPAHDHGADVGLMGSIDILLRIKRGQNRRRADLLRQGSWTKIPWTSWWALRSAINSTTRPRSRCAAARE